MLVPRTSAIGSGLWVGTPTMGDALGSTGRSERFRTKTPTPLEFVNKWPTPTSTLGTKGGRVTPAKAREGGTLIEALSARTMWRTPSAMLVEPKSTVVKLTGRKPTDPQVGLADQVGGKLNPTWVEWLMGWKLGWTDLKPLATDKFRCVPQPLGGCSLVANCNTHNVANEGL